MLEASSGCSLPDGYKSADRRLAKILSKKSSPLSQKWYKDKQQHVSKAQKEATKRNWNKRGIDLVYGQKINPKHLFPGLSSPPDAVVLDIGFGKGDSIINMARENPNSVYIGCEIHRSGIGSAFLKMEELNVTNVKLVRADVSNLLSRHLVDACLDKVCIYFPDPWPNSNRDFERRVVRPDVISWISKAIKPCGTLHVCTDVQDYARHTAEVMENFGDRWRISSHQTYEPGHRDCVNKRPVTIYELKARDMGHIIYDFVYERTPSSEKLQS